MAKKIIFTLIAVGLLAGGIIFWRYGGQDRSDSDKPQNTSRSQSRCGDGTCDSKEKADAKLCPQDCKAGARQGDQELQNRPGKKAGTAAVQESANGSRPANGDYGRKRFGFLGAYGQSVTKMADLWQTEFKLDLIDESSRLVGELGVGWTRESFMFTKGNQAKLGSASNQLSAAKSDGLQIFGTILVDQADYESDKQGYADWLKQTVEANSQVVKYWQLYNEVGKAGRFEDPADYVDFVKTSTPVIRANCSDCKVIMSSPIPEADYYVAVIEGADSLVDAYDIHVFEEAELANLADLNSRISKPLFVTEMATHSGDPSGERLAFQSEHDQAVKLIKWYTQSFFAGADYVFWSQFVEWYEFKGQVDGQFDFTGLVYNGLCNAPSTGNVCQDKSIDKGALVKKEAYSSLKALIAAVDGFETVEKISAGQYRFSVGGRNRYILWCDSGSCTLPAGISGTVTVTDYLGNKETKDAGAIKLIVDPIFIE